MPGISNLLRKATFAILKGQYYTLRHRSDCLALFKH